MSGLYCEISVIIKCLGCKSVVCLDNHTQWLRRLHVLVLFRYCLLFVAFEEQRFHSCNHHFRGGHGASTKDVHLAQ